MATLKLDDLTFERITTPADDDLIVVVRADSDNAIISYADLRSALDVAVPVAPGPTPAADAFTLRDATTFTLRGGADFEIRR